MEKQDILQWNKAYWDRNTDHWFGMTAMPTMGTQFATEDDLHLFGDVAGKRMLEVCCGSGHSIRYFAERNAAELWGVDISRSLIDNAREYLAQNHCEAKLICAPMEADAGIPNGYFDVVYSIYGMGWATDLQRVFEKIAGYLKKDGVFIFSWKHPISHCTVIKENRLIFGTSYFDESWFRLPLDDGEMTLCNRKISTYVNALANAGFAIERMVEQSSDEAMQSGDDATDQMKKAKMLPLSFCFKARKL